MIQEAIGEAAVSALTTHIIKWLTNLRRAGINRKQESRACLKQVILAVRKTFVYCRSLDEGAGIDYQKESEIAVVWTALSMDLEELKLTELAKKCRVTGWYWEDQGRFDQEFLEKAQISLSQIERLATKLLRELDS